MGEAKWLGKYYNSENLCSPVFNIILKYVKQQLIDSTDWIENSISVET